MITFTFGLYLFVTLVKKDITQTIMPFKGSYEFIIEFFKPYFFKLLAPVV